MYYNLPLFHWNVKVWKILGFLGSENLHRAYLLTILVVLTIAGQVMNLIYMRHDLGSVIMCIYTVMIFLSSLIRNLVVIKNQDDFIKFMREIENWHREAKLNNDVETWPILQKLSNRSKAISKFLWIFTAFAGVFTSFIPIILGQRAFPFGIYIFGFDVYKTPLYEVIYLIQALILTPFIVLSLVSYTNLFIAWLLFGINILKALRQKFKNLPCGNNRNMLKRLKALIIYHKKIIRFSKTLESLVSFVCLVELLLFGIILCVLMFCGLLVPDRIFQIATIMYIFFILYILFLSFWHANEFTEESIQIANAVYNIDWSNSNLEVRKCVLILLLRCQTPLMITAGGIYPMTLNTFQALLNAAYTYFNMLRGFMMK